MSDATSGVDAQEQLSRIERMNAETRKFVEEGIKLSAEARTLAREASLAPWQVAFAGFGADAAMVGAIAALLKFFG